MIPVFWWTFPLHLFSQISFRLKDFIKIVGCFPFAAAGSYGLKLDNKIIWWIFFMLSAIQPFLIAAFFAVAPIIKNVIHSQKIDKSTFSLCQLNWFESFGYQIETIEILYPNAAVCLQIKNILFPHIFLLNLCKVELWSMNSEILKYSLWLL